MAVSESYLWQQFKAGLEDDRTQLCRIENTAGTGISDVSGCHLPIGSASGIEAWIELKVFHGNNLHFRNSQWIWITRGHSVGRRIFVVARKDDEIRTYSAIDVVASHRYTNKKGTSFYVKGQDLPSPLYACGKPFKWEKMRSVIFG